MHVIKKICEQCGGDGVEGQSSITCSICKGTGRRDWMELDLSDIENKIDAIAVQVQALYDDLNP